MALTEIQSINQVQDTSKLGFQHHLRLKRLLDTSICIFVLPLLLVLIVVIGIAVALDSPGSPLFIQERVGKDGKHFQIYKFRTMRCDHDEQCERTFMQAYIAGQLSPTLPLGEKAKYKAVRKRDITRMGRFLRKYSLDELPQILNVLKGEMSLIGPRPNVPWEVEKYLDWHFERLKVLPGITGLAQVYGRSDLLFDDLAMYDIQYVRNLSLSLDLWIVWRTFTTVFTGHGAC